MSRYISVPKRRAYRRGMSAAADALGVTYPHLWAVIVARTRQSKRLIARYATHLARASRRPSVRPRA